VDNNYLNLGTNKSGFVHTLPVAGLDLIARFVSLGTGTRQGYKFKDI
jgi:hypothetical protein